MAQNDLFVSVIAPLKNAETIIADFIQEVCRTLQMHFSNYELILVDDNSQDRTMARVEQILAQVPCVRYIRLSRNFGTEIAITAGLETSIGDYVVVISPETDPTALIPEIVDRCRRGSGIVTGVSSAPLRRSYSSALFSRFFHWYTKKYLCVDLIPNATHFQCFSRQAVNAITKIKDRYRMIRLFSATVGFRNEPYPYPVKPGAEKKGKTVIWQNVNEAIEIIAANSHHPLRFVSWIGLLASALNLLYLIYIVMIYFFKSKVAEGWTTLSFQHAVMFFLIFVILAVLCEYTGKILEETWDRPLYVVLTESNSNVLISDATRRNVVRNEDE